MSLGWKILLPLSLAYIVIIASAIITLQIAGFAQNSWQFNGALFALNVVLVVVLFFLFDRGRIVSPASSRLDARHVQRLRAITASRLRRTPGLRGTGVAQPTTGAEVNR
jgi:hypothetical protein